MLATALADVQNRKAGWTAPDLTTAISAALPDHLGITDGAEQDRDADRGAATLRAGGSSADE